MQFEFHTQLRCERKKCDNLRTVAKLAAWTVFVVSGSWWSYQLPSDLIMSWCQSWQSGWSWKIFCLPKNFPRLTRLPRLSGSSHQIVWHRNKAQQNASCWIVLIGVDVGQEKQHDLLRCVAIYYDLWLASIYELIRQDAGGYVSLRSSTRAADWLRVPAFTYILNKIYVGFEIHFSICTRRFPIFTQKCIFSNMLEVQR